MSRSLAGRQLTPFVTPLEEQKPRRSCSQTNASSESCFVFFPIKREKTSGLLLGLPLPVLYSQTHLDKHDEVGRVACCCQRATGAVLTNSP